MVNVRSGPNWASIGSAHEALVGVRHSSTLCPAAQDRAVRHPGRILMAVVAVEVAGQLADAPVGERETEPGRTGLGHSDDDLDVGVGDPPRSSGAPPRRQHRQPTFVERVDDIADGVLVRGDQPGRSLALRFRTTRP